MRFFSKRLDTKSKSKSKREGSDRKKHVRNGLSLQQHLPYLIDKIYPFEWVAKFENLAMHILYTTQCCSTAREVLTTALYCKHWSYLPGWEGNVDHSQDWDWTSQVPRCPLKKVIKYRHSGMLILYTGRCAFHQWWGYYNNLILQAFELLPWRAEQAVWHPISKQFAICWCGTWTCTLGSDMQTH